VVTIAGYHEYGKQRLIQDLGALLGKEVIVKSQSLNADSLGWRLKVTDKEDVIEPGHSGAPVVDTRSGRVLGIVNQRKGIGEQGLVISIAALEKIWIDMPAQLQQKHQTAIAACLSVAKPRMNLDDELAAFARIAAGEDTETHLILVHGASGMGKTYLLSLYKKIANTYNLDFLDIPLGPQIQVVDCLDRMVSRYGWQYFASYDEVATEGVPDPLTRSNEKQWWRTLTRKFFMDLEGYREAPPLIVFFDPYEKADYAFKSWMSSIFLPKISVHCPITVIIAGQEVVAPVPPSKICRHFPLEGVTVDWYHHYVEARDAPIDQLFINELHKALGGQPKAFVEYVETELASGGRG
jgi:hypothetical protein